ncbi:sperm surface protein Sp17 [Chroicocephalus ridibundus]
MSTPFSNITLRLPDGFQNLLEGLAWEVLRAQPADVVAFAAQHFQKLLEQREGSSADPEAREARQQDHLLPQPPVQDEEKEDKEKEEKMGSTGTVRDTAPAPKTGLFEPKKASGAGGGGEGGGKLPAPNHQNSSPKILPGDAAERNGSPGGEGDARPRNPLEKGPPRGLLQIPRLAPPQKNPKLGDGEEDDDDDAGDGKEEGQCHQTSEQDTAP